MPLNCTGTRAAPSPTTKRIVTPSLSVCSDPACTIPPNRTAWPTTGGSASMALGT